MRCLVSAAKQRIHAIVSQVIDELEHRRATGKATSRRSATRFSGGGIAAWKALRDLLPRDEDMPRQPIRQLQPTLYCRAQRDKQVRANENGSAGARCHRGACGGRESRVVRPGVRVSAFVHVPDPVGAGFVDSLPRPGGTPPVLRCSNTLSAGNGWSCSRRSRPARRERQSFAIPP